MSVESWLSARQKDGKRIGFLKTGEQTLRDMLRPLRCAILSIPPEYGFALPGMVELLRQWNLYTNTKVRKHYDDYKYLKDVLHRPKQRSLDELKKIKYKEFLEKPLRRIIHLQTRKRRLEHFRADGTTTGPHRQPTLDGGSQAQRSVVSFPLCRPTPTNTLFILKEGSHFHGIKDPIIFFGKYCDLHCRDS